MPEAPPRNGTGEFALVMGIVAAAFSFIPIIGELVAAPASVLAVASGCVAISRVERGLATNPVSAWVGLGLGLVGGFITLLVFVATSNIAS